MEFANWLKTEELNSSLELPNASQILYTAAILDKNSQDYLVNRMSRLYFEAAGRMIPHGWIGRAHHATIKFKPNQADIDQLRNIWGQDVKLRITQWTHDNYGIAVMVQNTAIPFGKTPHVTVAHSREVGPVYSDTLMTTSNPQNFTGTNLELNAIIGAVGKDDQVFPNMLPMPLALQSFSF